MNQPYSFETGIYRPPSEGGSYSLLLRVTRNCPWNRCTFCAMYKEETYSMRSVADVIQDIDAISRIAEELDQISHVMGQGGEISRGVVMKMMDNHPELRGHHGFIMVVNWLISGGKTAFLQDANSLNLRSTHLVEILTYLRKRFPSLNRVTSYARSKTIAKRSPEELAAIRTAGLDRLHIGLETGDDELLQKIKKGVTAQEHIVAGQMAMAAGFQVSEYFMPGLGGVEYSTQHALNTARVLNEINPDYARSRPFFPFPGTPIQRAFENGEYQLLTPLQQLKELQTLVNALTFSSRLCFDHDWNHWSDPQGQRLFSLSYEGYQFPAQKEEVLGLIATGLSCTSP